jgi:hypothetical protein
MKRLNLSATIKNVGVCIFLGLAAASCKKTLDVNTDPNNPTDVPTTVLLPAAEVNLAYTLGGNASRYTGAFIQHYGGHRGQPLEYGQYNFSPSSSDNFWSSMYAGVLRDLKAVVEKSRASGDSMYVGVSQILMAHTFGVLTDLYGDIPFSDALNGVNSIAPKYDKQENIYPALITLIEAGVSNVKSNVGKKPATDDVIYNGTMASWEKYGNSLKLRLLNHLSKVQPNAAGDFLATNPALISSNAETAKVTFGTVQSNANPMHSFDILSGRKDMAVASTIVNKMKALDDPRIPKYFFPVKSGANAGQYIGNVPGGDNDDAGETKFSRTGPAFASISSPVILLSYSEVQFIVAEVRLRQNNILAATTAYNNAITADFLFVGNTAAEATAFLAKPAVAFDGSLSRLMEQKWIVMFQAPYESWTDWRRTGFPVLTPAAINFTQGVIPRKLPYPQFEINLNRASLEAGPGVPVPFESLKQKVWWDK